MAFIPLALPPSPDETVAALVRSDALRHLGVTDVRARDVDVLLVLGRAAGGAPEAFAYLWPDAELTGESTGEPQASLDEWVIEVALDMDEFLATEPAPRLHGDVDPASGLRIVRRYGTGP